MIKEILDQYGWVSVLLFLVFQWAFGQYKNQTGKDRKILLQIQRDVNMIFAFLRIMAGDQYHEIVKRINEEKVLRENDNT